MNPLSEQNVACQTSTEEAIAIIAYCHSQRICSTRTNSDRSNRASKPKRSCQGSKTVQKINQVSVCGVQSATPTIETVFQYYWSGFLNKTEVVTQ